MSRSVTVSGTNVAVARERVHRHLGALDVLLDEHASSARLGGRLGERGVELLPAADEPEAPLPLPVGRLDDARERQRRVVRRRTTRAWGTPAAANASRWRSFDVASAPTRASIGCGIPDALRDPCRDPDRPVRARRDDAVDVASAGEPLDALLVLGREHRPLVGEREADRLRVPVDRDHLHVAARPRGLEETELGGACA